jgi:agmatinase
LDASYQVEAFDGVSFPGDAGIHAVAVVDWAGEIQTVLTRTETIARSLFAREKIPVILGGEHSLSLAPGRALAALREDFGVVQIDAHADSRNTHEARRILVVDVVELAPLANLHSPSYVAAELTYALMGFAHRSRPDSR